MSFPFSFSEIDLITSSQNPKFKLWKGLLLTKNRKKEKKFILSGKKIIADFIKTDKHLEYQINAILIPNKEDIYEDLLEIISSLKVLDKHLLYKLDSSLFSEIDSIGTNFPVFICTSIETPTTNLSKHPQGLELICPIGDPNNLGALCRSALAFGVKKIVLTKNSTDPFHPKCIKSSSGSIFSLKFEILDKDLREVNKENLNSSDIGLDLEGENLNFFKWPNDCRLWLGEEGPGLKIIPKDQCLRIPIHGVESLNVAIAGSIAMYSYSLKEGS